MRPQRRGQRTHCQFHMPATLVAPKGARDHSTQRSWQAPHPLSLLSATPRRPPAGPRSGDNPAHPLQPLVLMQVGPPLRRPASPRPGSGECKAGSPWWPWTGAAGLQKAGRQEAHGRQLLAWPTGCGHPRGSPHPQTATPAHPCQGADLQARDALGAEKAWPQFPLGKAKGGKPRLGTACPPGREELGKAPHGSLAQGACVRGTRQMLLQLVVWRSAPELGQQDLGDMGTQET